MKAKLASLTAVTGGSLIAVSMLFAGPASAAPSGGSTGASHATSASSGSPHSPVGSIENNILNNSNSALQYWNQQINNAVSGQ
jgi:hypothetical protein